MAVAQLQKMDCLPSPKSYFIDQTNGLTKRYGMDLAYLGLGSAWCIHMLYSEAQLLRDLYSTSCLLLCSIFHYPHKPAIIIHLGTLCTSSLSFRKPTWKAHRSIIWTSNIQHWHQAACAPYHGVIFNRFKHFVRPQLLPETMLGTVLFLEEMLYYLGRQWPLRTRSGLIR